MVTPQYTEYQSFQPIGGVGDSPLLSACAVPAPAALAASADAHRHAASQTRRGSATSAYDAGVGASPAIRTPRMRFSANISFLFKDVAFGERFRRAADAGFRGVEFMWPGVDEVEAVARAVQDTGLEVALFNFDAGDMAAGERGLAGDPARRAEFRANVPIALELAARIGCPRLNALVGVHRPELDLEAQLEEARENVAWAAEQARAHRSQHHDRGRQLAAERTLSARHDG